MGLGRHTLEVLKKKSLPIATGFLLGLAACKGTKPYFSSDTVSGSDFRPAVIGISSNRYSGTKKIITTKSEFVKYVINESPAGPAYRKFKSVMKEANLDLDYRSGKINSGEMRSIDFAINPKINLGWFGKVEARLGILYPAEIDFPPRIGSGEKIGYLAFNKKW